MIECGPAPPGPRGPHHRVRQPAAAADTRRNDQVLCGDCGDELVCWGDPDDTDPGNWQCASCPLKVKLGPRGRDRKGPPAGPNYLTIGEVAQVLRVTTSAVYGQIKAGRLRAVKIGAGRNWRVSVEEFERFTGHPYRTADAPAVA